jgi:endonuclease/exonuclease/phosphatase family metal-dependent hydrolase
LRPGTDALTAVSFNVCGHPAMRHFRERAAAFCRRFEELGVDLACLQEVFTARQLRIVRDHLPSLPHAAWTRGRLGQPRGGLAILSRHPLGPAEFASFAGTARWTARPSGLRVAAVVGLKGVLVTRLPDLALTVAVTHPSANPDGDWSPTNRFHPMHQAQLAKLDAACRRLGVDLLCGDFNVTSRSDLYRRFLAEGGWDDPFAALDPPTFHGVFLGPGRRANRIDYLLLRPDGRPTAVEDVRLLFTEPVPLGSGRAAYVSDHMALGATLRVPAATPPPGGG